VPKTVGSALQNRLAELLVEARQAAGLRQVDLAKKLKIKQQQVSHLESGQRRIDVVELIELGKIIGFDPAQLVKKLMR
jgi:ribosome-binding protein aMBF1 (putative translation factor)